MLDSMIGGVESGSSGVFGGGKSWMVSVWLIVGERRGSEAAGRAAVRGWPMGKDSIRLYLNNECRIGFSYVIVFNYN